MIIIQDIFKYFSCLNLESVIFLDSTVYCPRLQYLAIAVYPLHNVTDSLSYCTVFNISKKVQQPKVNKFFTNPKKVFLFFSQRSQLTKNFMISVASNFENLPNNDLLHHTNPVLRFINIISYFYRKLKKIQNNTLLIL